MEIFPNTESPNYGSINIIYKNTNFDITTFRRDIKYQDNRLPVKIKYIKNIKKDLLRRDFTINTLCMDKDGEIIDFLGGREDIENKIIRTVGNAKTRFEEDSLRILRAIRFSTILDFKLDKDVRDAIISCRGLLKNLSYYRKKEELDKIFGSSRAKDGISLLLDLGLDKFLDLDRLKDVTSTNSLIGVWSVLNVTDKYPFNSNEKQLIKEINLVLKLNNTDPVALYTHGLYVNSVAGEIKGINIKKITDSYNKLVIQSKKDLKITSDDIMALLDRKPGSYLKDIYADIEREVLYRRLSNDKKSISKYIIDKYK